MYHIELDESEEIPESIKKCFETILLSTKEYDTNSFNNAIVWAVMIFLSELKRKERKFILDYIKKGAASFSKEKV